MHIREKQTAISISDVNEGYADFAINIPALAFNFVKVDFDGLHAAFSTADWSCLSSIADVNAASGQFYETFYTLLAVYVYIKSTIPGLII